VQSGHNNLTPHSSCGGGIDVDVDKYVLWEETKTVLGFLGTVHNVLMLHGCCCCRRRHRWWWLWWQWWCMFMWSTDMELMGSVARCEMLQRTNLLAIVAGGSRPKFAENTVLVYDDISKKFVLEFTFTTPVKAVRLRWDKWVLLTHTWSYVILSYIFIREGIYINDIQGVPRVKVTTSGECSLCKNIPI